MITRNPFFRRVSEKVILLVAARPVSVGSRSKAVSAVSNRSRADMSTSLWVSVQE
jgi:hypothetical protein